MADDRRVKQRERILHPGAIVVTAFAFAILIGTSLLALPFSHRAGVHVPVGDAFFTASSAVTVTGLAVNDTGAVWSTFGEVVPLLLIQIGGLGIMTLAGFLGIAFNRRLASAWACWPAWRSA